MQHTLHSMCITLPLSMRIHLTALPPYRRGPVLCNSPLSDIHLLNYAEKGGAAECEECYWLHFQRMPLRTATRVTQRIGQQRVKYYADIELMCIRAERPGCEGQDLFLVFCYGEMLDSLSRAWETVSPPRWCWKWLLAVLLALSTSTLSQWCLSGCKAASYFCWNLLSALHRVCARLCVIRVLPLCDWYAPSMFTPSCFSKGKYLP